MKVRVFWPYLGVCGSAVVDGLLLGRDCIRRSRWSPSSRSCGTNRGGSTCSRIRPDDDAVHHFEHEWNTAVQLILFLFGLGERRRAASGGYDTGTWALLVAALVGRPLGILPGGRRGGSGRLHLPRRIGWREIVVIARRVVDRIHDRAVLCHRASVERSDAFTTHRRRARHVGRRRCSRSAPDVSCASDALPRDHGDNAMSFVSKRDASVAGEIRRLVSSQLEVAISELRTVGDPESDEAVHDARRRVKKIRAVIRLVRPALDKRYRGGRSRTQGRQPAARAGRRRPGHHRNAR